MPVGPDDRWCGWFVGPRVRRAVCRPGRVRPALPGTRGATLLRQRYGVVLGVAGHDGAGRRGGGRGQRVNAGEHAGYPAGGDTRVPGSMSHTTTRTRAATPVSRVPAGLVSGVPGSCSPVSVTRGLAAGPVDEVGELV